MTEREALERIAKDDVGHRYYCWHENCDCAGEFARRVLAGKDPDAPKPKRQD